MQRYILGRLLATIPVLGVVAVVVFVLLRVLPGDPALAIMGIEAPDEQLRDFRKYLGLDKPIHEQFIDWSSKMLTGDLGYSALSRSHSGSAGKISIALGKKWRPSLVVAVSATAATVILGVPLGVLAAYRFNSLLDRGIVTFASLGFAMPVFWQGFLAIWVFALILGWLPVLGYSDIENVGVLGYLKHLILPVSVLATSSMAVITRMTRSTVLEVLAEDYVRTARAKGLAERKVLMVHALKPAFPPILTLIGLNLAGLIHGAILIETIFAIPGLGSWAGLSMGIRDYNVIQVLILYAAIMYVLVNLVIDIAYAYLDPRIRYQ